MFLIRLVLLPVRLVLGAGVLGVRLGFVTGRLLGYRRLLVFGAGVAVGLAVAPGPGRQLRDRVVARVTGRSAASDDEITERVRYELSHSPRTWHLPQPDVEVVAGTAILHGEAPHDVGREDLERAAAAVPGVVAVDNRVHVTAEQGSEPEPSAQGTNGHA